MVTIRSHGWKQYCTTDRDKHALQCVESKLEEFARVKVIRVVCWAEIPQLFLKKRKMLHGELPQESSKLLLIQMNSLHFISSGDGTVKPQGTTVHMENYTCFGLLIKVRPQMLTPYILIQRYTYFKVREIMIFSTSKMSDQMHVDSQHYHHEAPKK